MIPATAETTEDLKAILAGISFAKSCIDFDWNWEVEELIVDDQIQGDGMNAVIHQEKLRGWFVNTTFKRPDINTGKVDIGKGRQLFVAKGWTQSAIFFTCWIAIELIVKHELMEAIRWDGKRVLNPHHSLAELSMPDIVKASKLPFDTIMHRATYEGYEEIQSGN